MKGLFISLLLFASFRLTGQSSYYITRQDGAKLFVQEFGQGKPLVILAGGPGLDAVYMKGVWENLSTKFRCIVLDQRGTGKSTLAAVDSNNVSLGKFVDDIDALRKHLKLEQINLVGHSWGGMLSMEYAARYPKHVKQLILLGSGGPTGKFFKYFSDNMKIRFHDEDLREIAQLDSMKKPSLRGYWAGYFFDRNRALATKSETNIEALLGQPIRPLLIPAYISSSDERAKLLKAFNGGVCIIQGRQDPIGESTVYEIKDLFPQAQIHFIEKCGHLPWLENAEQVKDFFSAINNCLQ